MTNDSDEKERDWALEHWRKIQTAYLREDENNRDEGSQARRDTASGTPLQQIPTKQGMAGHPCQSTSARRLSVCTLWPQPRPARLPKMSLTVQRLR